MLSSSTCNLVEENAIKRTHSLFPTNGRGVTRYHRTLRDRGRTVACSFFGTSAEIILYHRTVWLLRNAVNTLFPLQGYCAE